MQGCLQSTFAMDGDNDKVRNRNRHGKPVSWSALFEDRQDPVSKILRQIVLDTETTGLSPEEGHRIIEIGCIEIINRKITQNRFHVYLNPDREIDHGAIEVHGISNEFLAGKPRFPDIADDFLAFVRGAELVIHNAPFDIGFINREISLSKRKETIENYCTVTDTLTLARKKHPGQRNSLDALCKRYGINNSHRQLHGALLDAEILADVYLTMTGGQTSILEIDHGLVRRDDTELTRLVLADRPKLKIVHPDETEMESHRRYLELVNRESGGHCLWLGEG
jgi:DNA polymerase III subunit epsilon